MPDPIEFRIVQHQQAALQAIQTVDGYFHDVAAVAVKLDADHDVESLIGDQQLRPFVILELTPDSFIYRGTASRLRVQLPFTVHAVHDADLRDDASWLQTYLRLCADVERALVVDITRGGLAVDTRILTREFHAYGGQQVWAMLRGEIHVERVYGQPNG